MGELGSRDSRKHEKARVFQATLVRGSEAVPRREAKVEADLLDDLDGVRSVILAGLAIRIGERSHGPANPRFECPLVPKDLIPLLFETRARQDRMVGGMPSDLDARKISQRPEFGHCQRGVRVAACGLRRGSDYRPPLPKRQRLDPLDFGFASSTRNGVVPQKTLALDGVTAREDDGGDGIPLQDGSGQGEDRAIPVVEGEENWPWGQGGATGQCRPPLIQADGMTSVSYESAVSLELACANMELAECSRPSRQIIIADAVIAEHRDPWERIPAQSIPVVTRSEQTPLHERREHGVHAAGAEPSFRHMIVVSTGYLGSEASSSDGVSSSSARPSIAATAARQLP